MRSTPGMPPAHRRPRAETACARMICKKNQYSGRSRPGFPALLVAVALLFAAIQAASADDDRGDGSRGSGGSRSSGDSGPSKPSDSDSRSSDSGRGGTAPPPSITPIKTSSGGSTATGSKDNPSASPPANAPASGSSGGGQVMKVFPTTTIIEIQNATTDPKVIEFMEGLLTELMDMKTEQAKQNAVILSLTTEVRSLKARQDYLNASTEFARLKEEGKEYVERAAHANVLGKGADEAAAGGKPPAAADEAAAGTSGASEAQQQGAGTIGPATPVAPAVENRAFEGTQIIVRLLAILGQFTRTG
jgi:hypothetical protein